MTMYAIFSWNSERGPIKSWDQMASVEMHNGRMKPIAHGIEGAPAPIFLVGSREITAEVRQRLVQHGIDPGAIRKGGVIAHEAIITASREFFYLGSKEDQQARLEGWTRAQVDFVMRRYGKHRVASLVLHQDEQTPHIHAVVIPFKHSVDRRRRDLDPQWGLDGQILTAKPELSQLQTDYGMAMARFGLSRGRISSNDKHKPYAVVMAEVEAERAAIKLREADIQEREQELAACLIRLRDGWKGVDEKSREAAAAREIVTKLLEELKLRENDYQAVLTRERRLAHNERALREREKAVAAREDVLESRRDTQQRGTGASRFMPTLPSHLSI
jgi:hypothetical protein